MLFLLIAFNAVCQAHLAAIIKSLGVAPANIVGHSYGGTVALFLALQHPELVRTVVLGEAGRRSERYPRRGSTVSGALHLFLFPTWAASA